MTTALALAPTFTKGVAVIVCSLILFVGSVYVLLTAIFGLRMGYLVLAVSFFGWMIIFSLIWVLGQPSILGVSGTPKNEGPRGTEPHWQVFAAGTGAVQSKYPETKSYPGGRWQAPNAFTKPSVDTVDAVIQSYLAQQAIKELQSKGTKVCNPAKPPLTQLGCFNLDPTTFSVEDVEFVTAKGSTQLVGTHAAYTLGGPEVTVFAYRDKGDVPIYSYAFLIASVLGFLIHLPLLDKAERKRKAILTGGTAPPWFGPA